MLQLEREPVDQHPVVGQHLAAGVELTTEPTCRLAESDVLTLECKEPCRVHPRYAATDNQHALWHGGGLESPRRLIGSQRVRRAAGRHAPDSKVDAGVAGDTGQELFGIVERFERYIVARVIKE